MPIMLKGDTSVLFIHIPKCGGSTFERCMADRGWQEFLSIRGVNAKNLRFMHCTPQHMHVELLSSIVRPEYFDKIVTLVREPSSRLKSEYAWQRAQSITNLAPAVWIEHAFSAFKQDPFVYDNHIRPQNEFILNESLIYKLEQDGINQALNAVSPIQIKRNLFKKIFRGNEVKQLKKTIKPIEIHEAFDKKLSQIQDFYGKDYEVIGYETT
jgi:hypothetical protein